MSAKKKKNSWAGTYVTESSHFPDQKLVLEWECNILKFYIDLISTSCCSLICFCLSSSSLLLIGMLCSISAATAKAAATAASLSDDDDDEAPLGASVSQRLFLFLFLSPPLAALLTPGRKFLMRFL